MNTSGPLAGRTVTAITAGDYHSCVVAAVVPQPPTGVAGAPGDGQVAVSWTTRADNGGSPVLDCPGVHRSGFGRPEMVAD